MGFWREDKSRNVNGDKDSCVKRKMKIRYISEEVIFFLKIFTSNTRGVESNAIYPKELEVTDTMSFKRQCF